MKKYALCLIIVLVLVSCVALFVGCNNNTEKCIITFVVSDDGHEISYNKTITPSDFVTLNDFIELKGDDFSIGQGVYTGLFIDSGCIFKFDDEQAIYNNTTLYVKKSPSGTPIINFWLDGKKYPLAIEATKPVGIFDFIVSAYGKSAIPEQFDFFKDEQCTQPLELTNYNYKICTFDFWQQCNIFVKKHNIANVTFCIHNNNGVCATTFRALIRTDEYVLAQTLQELYREYSGDDTIDFKNATLYSDASLKNVITHIGNLKNVHINIAPQN